MKTAMEKHNLTVSDLAKKLDVSASQIYKWRKEGISVNNKYFYKLREILPEIVPKEVTLKKNGEEDQRFKSGRTQKQIDLTVLPEDNVSIEEKEFKSSLFPRIRFKTKN